MGEHKPYSGTGTSIVSQKLADRSTSSTYRGKAAIKRVKSWCSPQLRKARNTCCPEPSLSCLQSVSCVKQRHVNSSTRPFDPSSGIRMRQRSHCKSISRANVPRHCRCARPLVSDRMKIQGVMEKQLGIVVCVDKLGKKSVVDSSLLI